MASDLLDMSVELTKGYLTQNQLSLEEVPELLRSIHQTLADLRTSGSAAATATATAAPTASTSASSPSAAAGAQDAPEAKRRGPKPGAKRAAAEKAAAEAEAEVTDVQPTDVLVAPIRDEDISDPAYKGLDPWLAMRISPSFASKLDPNNKPHPTVFQDKLICLEDGKEVKLLRAYVRKNFGLEFHQYMSKWNLPTDYPTAPPAYLANKRDIAKKTGLGVTTRAHRENRAAAAPAAIPAKTAKAKPGPKRGVKPTKKEIQAAEASTAKAAGARGTRRALTLFPDDKEKKAKAAEPSMAN
jgi:predicted transcriptional regulator